MKSKAKKQAASRKEAVKQETKKREETNNSPRSAVEGPCLYCGKPTLCRDYIVNPGAQHELPCCSTECFDKAKAFIDYDKRCRTPFYMVLLVFVVANLFMIGLNMENRWKYLPMLGLAVTAFVCPLVFTRYERYQMLGIHKSKNVIRMVAAAVAAFALALMIGY